MAVMNIDNTGKKIQNFILLEVISILIFWILVHFYKFWVKLFPKNSPPGMGSFL